MMKVLLLNGSPNVDGVIARGLAEIEKVLNQEGIETETVQVGKENIPGCKACGYCYKHGECVYHDLVNEVAKKFEASDGIVLGSPVYYASPNGTFLAFLDRLFYSSNFDKSMKVGASIVSARRAGTSTSYDVLNKYFGISNMVCVGSQYWNNLHGNNKIEAELDKEGLQTMRTLAKNMAFLIKSIQLGKKAYGLPKKEEAHFVTNFIKE